MGSGKGLFLITASGERPQHNFLGCEIAHKYARLAAARLARAGRDNAAVVDGDALQLFRERLPDACAVAVHAYFPDPWWKQRHRKRRVMKPAFLADVERVLQPEGAFHFWTDVKEYFDTTVALIAEVTSLLGPFDGRAAAGQPTTWISARTLNAACGCTTKPYSEPSSAGPRR